MCMVCSSVRCPVMEGVAMWRRVFRVVVNSVFCVARVRGVHVLVVSGVRFAAVVRRRRVVFGMARCLFNNSVRGVHVLAMVNEFGTVNGARSVIQ